MSAPSSFSHSRLSTLDDCPRRYRYRYVERRREAFTGIEAFRGQVAHAALGWLYLEREARREPGAEELIARYREEWAQRHSARVRIIQPPKADRGSPPEDVYRREAEDWLRGHHAQRFLSDRRETLAMEPKVSLELAGREYSGFVDRLAKDGAGRLHVIDFKTGRRVPESLAAAGLQVHGYGAAILESHGGEDVALEYDYLQQGRLIGGTLSRADAAGVREQLSGKITETLAAEAKGDFPARPSRLCAWCGFREICDVSGFMAGSSVSDGAAGPAASGGGPGALGPCPQCSGELRLREGRRGPFVGCAAYPDCRFTRDALPGEVPAVQGDGETTCPRCGRPLRRRSGARGDFLGCTGFPDCRFSRDAGPEALA